MTTLTAASASRPLNLPHLTAAAPQSGFLAQFVAALLRSLSVMAA